MTLQGPGWYDKEELLGEFEPVDDSSVDNLTPEEQALIDRGAEIKAIVDTDITQPYPTVSQDF